MRRDHPGAALKLVLALLVSLVANAPVAAATAEQPGQVGVSDAVLAAFQQEPRVRVLVELATPQEPGAGLNAQERAALSAVQDTVLASLGSRDTRLLQRYEHVPYLALEVTESAA